MRASCKIVFLVTCQPRNSTTFCQQWSVFPILIYNIINCTLIIFKEDLCIKNIITNKNFLRYPGKEIHTIFSDSNNIIDIRAIADEFIFFKTGSNKSFLIIYKEFCVVGNHFSGLNCIKTSQLCFSFPSFSVLFLYLSEIVYGERNDIFKMIFNFFYLNFNSFYMFIGFFYFEFRDTLNLYFRKLNYILSGHFPV